MNSNKEIENLPHLNIMFIGHVDSGKSTISGNILFMTGMVDVRTIEKYKNEAVQKGRDSWFLAYIMDSVEEERDKGKTVEVGRAIFRTEKRRYTILDAPGHQSYIQNMIEAATQADIGILVISARRGEFERGFDRGGQTREHALIAKTLNVSSLLVVVNKMDEKTVKWNESRFTFIKSKLTPFLKSIGFKNVQFVPISGLTGENIITKLDNWYEGETLMDILDSIKLPKRKSDASVRIPILDRYMDHGKLIVMGNIKQGTLKKNDTLIIAPHRNKVDVTFIETDFNKNADNVSPGENVLITVKGINDINSIRPGHVLCGIDHPSIPVNKFRASLLITNVRENVPIFTIGTQAMMHIHTCVEQVTFEKIVTELGKNGKPIKNKRPPKFIKKKSRCIVDFVVDNTIYCETYKDNKGLSTFTIRDESRTLGIGKIIRIIG